MDPRPSLFRPLIAHHRWVIAAFVLLAAAAAPGLLQLRIDNSPEGFFVQDAGALERFRRLELTFARDRAVRIVLSGERLWTGEGLAYMAALERLSQEEIQGVLGSAGPYRHHRWHLAAWPPEDPETFRAMVAADRVDRAAGWVSSDGDTVTILAGLARMTPVRRRATLEALDALIADPPDGIRTELAGIAVVNRALDRALVRMAVRFFPALLGVAVLLLAAVFRNTSGVLLPLAAVGVCQSVVLGAMGYSGQRLDVVTIILVPLLFVISLATAIHVLAYQRRIRTLQDLGPEEATLATYRVKAWPVVWTGVTTGVGFGALAVSAMPPVRALGLWSAFAMAFLTLTMLSLYPALLASLPGRRGRQPEAVTGETIGRWAASMGRFLAASAIARPRVVAVLFGLAALGAAAGVPRLRIETNVLSFFPTDSEIHRRTTGLEEHGIGSVAASLVIQGGSDLRLDAPAALRRQTELAARLGREPRVLGALSAGDLVTGVARRLAERDPAEGPGLEPKVAGAIALIGREPDLDRMLGYLVTEDGDLARITLLLPMRGYEELGPLFDRLRTEAERAFPEARIWISGQYPLVLAAQRTLLRTMVLSLTLTALAVALVFRLVLGSFALAGRALIPNLWPVLCVLGMMGWADLPVDSATVMVASVVLGLAVDDTLHSLGSFRRLLPTRTAEEAAVATLGETAGAHGLTSLILTIGFGVVGLSELIPVARFGALAAGAVFAALAADLGLVPVLLARAPERALSRLAAAPGAGG